MNIIPWYRQFWPWVLIFLPLSSVIAGVSTVFIAFSNSDDLVHDQWYKEGRMINQTLIQDSKAKTLKLDTTIEVVDNEKIIFLLNQSALDLTTQLQINLEHPTQKKYDQMVVLQYAGNNKWVGTSDIKLIGKYYLTITPPDRSWRLKSEANFVAGRDFTDDIHP